MTGTASYEKEYGDSFTLDARSSGDGTLHYESGDTSVAEVSDAGEVTLKNIGTVSLTVYADGTDYYQQSDVFTVCLTVEKGTQTVSGTSAYTKTYGSSAFTLRAKNSGDEKLKYKSGNTSVAAVSSTGKVTIKGIGTARITVYAAESSYAKKSNTLTVTIKVIPRGTSLSSVTAAAKAFTAKWKKQSTKTTGYQIQYSSSSKFSSAKTITVKGSSVISKKITKLTSKKKYYVRIRTYKTVSGKNYYSSWSSAKTVKTK